MTPLFPFTVKLTLQTLPVFQNTISSGLSYYNTHMPHVRWQVAVIPLPLCTGNEAIPAYSAMTKQSLLLFIFYSGIARFQELWE